MKKSQVIFLLILQTSIFFAQNKREVGKNDFNLLIGKWHSYSYGECPIDSCDLNTTLKKVDDNFWVIEFKKDKTFYYTINGHNEWGKWETEGDSIKLVTQYKPNEKGTEKRIFEKLTPEEFIFYEYSFFRDKKRYYRFKKITK